MDKWNEWGIRSDQEESKLGAGSKTTKHKFHCNKVGLWNKLNEDGKVVINMDKLVWKGYAQVEGIYFEEMVCTVERLEAIRMFLAFKCQKNFKAYHMDVKSTFLNGKLEGEDYIKQTLRFSTFRQSWRFKEDEKVIIWTNESNHNMVCKTRQTPIVTRIKNRDTWY